MPVTPIRLGPFAGIDNIHAPDAQTFQVPNEAERGRLSALVAATNVDLDDDGWVVSRSGTTVIKGLTVTAGKSLFSALGVLLLQDGTSIRQINLKTETATDLVVGLAAGSRVAFHEFDGSIYWTDATYCGMIGVFNGVAQARPWGAMPPEMLTATPDYNAKVHLPYGPYLFAVTSVDAHGVESGASVPISATIGADFFTGTTSNLERPTTAEVGATVSLFASSYDPYAVSLRYYMSDLGGGPLYYVCSGVPGESKTIDESPETSRFPLKTTGMIGPVPGYGVFSYRKVIGTYRGRWIYPSVGLSPHLFSPQRFSIQLPHNICAVEGLAGALFVATEGGLFKILGDSKEALTTVQVDSLSYMRGSHQVTASALPATNANGKVALFVSADGLVVGMPDGQVVYPTKSKYSFGAIAGKRAYFAHTAHGDLSQILITVVDAETEVEDYVPPMDLPVIPVMNNGRVGATKHAEAYAHMTTVVEELNANPWPGVPNESVFEE